MFSVLVIRLRSLRLLRVSGIVMRLRMFLLLITFLKASHSFRNRLLVICKRSEERRVGKECRCRGSAVRRKRRCAPRPRRAARWPGPRRGSGARNASSARTLRAVFFFKQKPAYELGLGIPAEPLFRSLRMFLLLITFLKASHSFRNRLLVICKNAYLFATMIMTSVSSPFSCCSGIVRLNLM